jgi:hypothetical protein
MQKQYYVVLSTITKSVEIQRAITLVSYKNRSLLFLMKHKYKLRAGFSFAACTLGLLHMVMNSVIQREHGINSVFVPELSNFLSW